MYKQTKSGYAVFPLDNNQFDIFRGSWEPWSRFEVSRGKLILLAGAPLSKDDYNEVKFYLL